MSSLKNLYLLAQDSIENHRSRRDRRLWVFLFFSYLVSRTKEPEITSTRIFKRYFKDLTESSLATGTQWQSDFSASNASLGTVLISQHIECPIIYIYRVDNKTCWRNRFRRRANEHRRGRNYFIRLLKSSTRSTFAHTTARMHRGTLSSSSFDTLN